MSLLIALVVIYATIILLLEVDNCLLICHVIYVYENILLLVYVNMVSIGFIPYVFSMVV